MASEYTKPYEDKMNKTLAALDSDYATIRAGRANPHVLDKIMVDYYGTPTPINQVGNIAVPEPRMIQIQPWDKSMLKAIEKAINMSELGIHPGNDGSVIRLIFPELSEERRKELNKDVKKKAEASKVAIRNIRRDAMDNFKKLEKKKLPQDLDYSRISGLRIEARQKLEQFRPVSIGQASRIAGVSPADISVLLVYMETYRRTAGKGE